MSSLSCAGPDTSREPQPVTREKCSLADFDAGAATKTSLWYLWSPMVWKWRLFTFKLKFGPFQKGFCLWCASHFQYCSANSSWVFFVVVSFPKQSLFVFINFLMIVIIILFYFFRMSMILKKKQKKQCQRSFCVNRVQSWAFVTGLPVQLFI